jgi:glycosyltransferase involved in cell wall biosynthesis
MRTATARRICAPDKVRLLDGGVGIDLAKFDRDQFPPDTRRQVREELGWTAAHCVVGFVGRLVREKGLAELFAAVADVRRQVPELRLMLVGPVDAAKRDAVDPRLAEQYGIDDICRFTGLCLDMARMYCAMDIFVLPSHREGLPLSVMEAQAMGVPVITTNARGCSESVAPGVSGLVVPVKNAAALGEALRTLAADAALRQRMGEAARQVARSRFDRRLVCRFHEQEYRRLLEQVPQ